VLPIFKGSVAEGDLREALPNADRVLEMAHPLWAQEDAVKPIIARFYAREIRTLVFRPKKAYAPKHKDVPPKIDANIWPHDSTQGRAEQRSTVHQLPLYCTYKHNCTSYWDG
jgi:hypothetical protein